MTCRPGRWQKQCGLGCRAWRQTEVAPLQNDGGGRGGGGRQESRKKKLRESRAMRAGQHREGHTGRATRVTAGRRRQRGPVTDPRHRRGGGARDAPTNAAEDAAVAVAADGGAERSARTTGLEPIEVWHPPPPLVVSEEAEAAGRARAGCADGGCGASGGALPEGALVGENGISGAWGRSTPPPPSTVSLRGSELSRPVGCDRRRVPARRGTGGEATNSPDIVLRPPQIR